MKSTYQTKGKQKLIGFFQSNPDCQFTVEEICLAVNGDTAHKKSSVYRLLTTLCENETLRKFHSDERNCYVYQYVGKQCDCDHHFHQKCLKCGKLDHLDCADSEKFAAHLLKEHGFAVNCGQSILYGLCAACQEREAAAHA